MTTPNPTALLDIQVAHYDRLLTAIDAGDETDDSIVVGPTLGLIHRLEVQLATDPEVVVIADLGFSSEIEEASLVVRLDQDQVIESRTVEPGSSLWRAVEIWIDDFRN